jgi:hypothetical protein
MMRSACAIAVYSQIPKFGGVGKTVELAAVHLTSPAEKGGTNSVEVLGVYDRATRLVRLLAVDRARNNVQARVEAYKSYLSSVVHAKSVICVDNSLDAASLAPALPNAKFQQDNRQTAEVVGYLTKHVPKIFANTLRSLSAAQIQPFLDELAWREKWGRSAADAYDNIMAALASETSKCSSK